MATEFIYGVVGAGRQGTAAAYYLAEWASARRVIVADHRADASSQACARVNRLVGRDVAQPAVVDASDPVSLAGVLSRIDTAVCAVPYRLILACTEAAIATGTNMVDLGGHTDTVTGQLALDETVRRAQVTIVPDCGMGPGMSNTMGLATLEMLRKDGAKADELRLWEGGLPATPPPPWGYVASFSVEGLTNEYDGEAVFLRGGRITPVEALTEPEHVWFDELGTLEALVTSGGTSTLAHSLEGHLSTLENKTCRYPGHFQQFRAFKDLGLFSERPVTVDGTEVVPRRLYHALLDPQLRAERIEDICLIRATATGAAAGKPAQATLELVERHDPATGLSAMERVTGGHAALMAAYVAEGAVPPGVRTVENTVAALSFLERAKGWGFDITRPT